MTGSQKYHDSLGQTGESVNHVFLTRFVLSVGYLSLAAAILVAHAAPASGYEVSLYTSTPPLFWAGVAVALLPGVVIPLFAIEDRVATHAALVLLGLAVVSVLALPLIRGFYYYGGNDAVTHIQSVRGLATGTMAPNDIIYPAPHLLSVLLSAVTGVGLLRGMMYASLAFRVVFFLFVPLAAYLLYPRRHVLFMGVFSAVLLLPINHISTSQDFHPFSMALMFSPLVYYLLLSHITNTAEDESLPDRLSAASLALPVTTVAFLLIHAQATLDLLVFLTAIVVAQTLYRYKVGSSKGYQMIYGQYVVLLLAFVLWSGQFGRTYNLLESTITTAQSLLQGSAQPSPTIQHQQDSVTSIGGSLFEVFLKLFGINALYTVLAGGFVVHRFFDEDWTSRLADPVLYIMYGGLALIPVMVVYFFGPVNTYFFRHLGFGMVLITLLGAVAIGGLLTRVAPLSPSLRLVGTGLALVVLVAGVVTVFSSPFIYQPSGHTTQMEMEGYGSMADHHAPGVNMTSLRTSGARFAAAAGHDPSTLPLVDPVNDSVPASRLPAYYEEDTYIWISDRVRQQEVIAYDELRYSREYFRQLPRTDGVHHVQTNGGFDVYYVD